MQLTLRRTGVRVSLSLALGAAFVLVASAADSSRQARSSTPFRSGVNLISLMVSVVDRDGRFVTDLGRDDFTVFEAGVPQELMFFSAGDVPLDLAILLDTSSSMQDKLPLVQEARDGLRADASAERPGGRRRVQRSRQVLERLHLVGRRARGSDPVDRGDGRNRVVQRPVRHAERVHSITERARPDSPAGDCGAVGRGGHHQSGERR